MYVLQFDINSNIDHNKQPVPGERTCAVGMWDEQLHLVHGHQIPIAEPVVRL
jgi:hypothetical protein